VIIVEATMHHLVLRKGLGRLTQQQMDEEVFKSASKIRSSAAFGEIIILIVYIPILTLIGIEGKMFRPMAQTVGFAILGALILSLTYIPMMCALFLPKNGGHQLRFSERLMAFFQRLYSPMLEWTIRYSKLVIGLTVSVLALSVVIFARMGGEFIPTLQEGDYAFHCILPQGTSLSQSIETSMQASRLIKQFDEVKMVIGKTGSAEVPTDPMPPEATDVVIVLKPKDEWKRNLSYDELADEMLETLEQIPGVFFEKNQPIQMRFNELMTGVRQDVAVKIFGENLDTLLFYANKVQAVVRTVKGSSEPMVERVEGLPQVVINYNRAQIASHGLNIEDINHLVSTAFAGGNAGVVFENERRFDLVVRLDSAHRGNIDDVGHLYIPTPSGAQIPLSQVADIKLELGPAQISREDGKRRIVVGFNINGRDVSSVVKDIQAKLDQSVKLPEGYYYVYGGTFENLQAASKRLMIAVPIALLLIFMLLYFTFSSVKQALLIFTAIPMSAIGGVFALLIRGMPFSISAGIGFIALFGVAVLNGIVLIGTFNQLEKEGMTDLMQRLREGTKTRLRPVLMTALVASLGFFPMALSQGAGAEVQKPLATVVIGGLATATFLTLFVLPVLYLLFSPKKKARFNPTVSVLTLLLLVSPFAQAQVPVLSADEAVAMALKNNPQAQAQQLRVQSAQSLRRSGFELPKTSANMQYGQYNSINQDLGFQLSQSIPFPTSYSARSGLYKAQLQGAQLSQQAYTNTLRFQVQSLYHELVYLQQSIDQLRGLDSLYADFMAMSALRYKTGETGLLEKTTAEAKQGQLKLLLLRTESDRVASYAALKTLLNTPGDFTVDVRANTEPLLLSGKPDTALIANNPTLKVLYQDALIAEKSRKLEAAQAMPDLSIGYFNQSLMGVQTINGEDVYFGRSKRFQGVNAGISLPLTFFSNTARLKSMRYEREALQKTADNEKLLLQAELIAAFEQYNQALAQYEYYKSTGMSNATSIANTARSSLHSGHIGYIEYLQALQTTSEIRLGYLQSLNELNQSVIRIHSIMNQ